MWIPLLSLNIPLLAAVLFRSAFQGFAKPFYQQLEVPRVSVFLTFLVL